MKSTSSLPLASLGALFVISCTSATVTSKAKTKTAIPNANLPPIEERELSGGQRHSHEIDVPAEHFVLVAVDQRGIDLIVRLYDPEGKMLQQVDSPSGDVGIESIAFTSKRPGTYRVEVAAFSKDAKPGRYAFKVERLEPAAKDRGGRVEQLMSRWRRDDAPGATLAIVQNGAIVHSRAYGMANLEHGVPNQPGTAFHVASVSKQVTAFAVTMLAEQGKLSLSDDVRKHLPEVPDFGKTITLEHLIHHMSGLRDQWVLSALSGTRLDDVISRDHILSLVRRQTELNFEPGAEFVYCNTGFTLLAEVVARVSGMSFSEWTRRNLFEPLGMKNSHFHDDHEKLIPGRADSYSADGAGYRKNVLSFANVGATSLHTTAEDMAKWLINLDDGRVGGPRVVNSVHERGVLTTGERIVFAAGLVHGEHRGLKNVGHGGADAGFRATTARYPDQGFGVVVMSNLASFPAGSIAQQIAEIYLEEHMTTPATNSKDATSGPPAASERLDDFVGQYRLQIGLVVTITRDGDKLVAQAPGQPPFVLEGTSDTEFTVRGLPVSVTFMRNQQGAVDKFMFNQGGQKMLGERVTLEKPVATRLEDYVGDYVSPELDTTYKLSVREGKLVAEHIRNGTISLTEDIKDEFSGSQWYFDKVRFHRDESGVVKQMLVSQGRMRNVRFIKQ